MEEGKWEMGNGKWEMGNGKWEMGNNFIFDKIYLYLNLNGLHN
jgi:hypothetical protein